MIHVTTSPQDPLGPNAPKPCPNCGHCPTCGHTPPKPYYWPHPWTYPNTNPWGAWWGINSTGTTINNTGTLGGIGGTVGL